MNIQSITEKHLHPGEHILLLNPAPAQWKAWAGHDWDDFISGLTCSGTGAMMMIFLGIHMGPELPLGVQLLPLLLLMHPLGELWLQLRSRRWQVITNRRLLFFSVRGRETVIYATPLQVLRFTPEDVQHDGSGSLRICAPRRWSIDIPATHLRQIPQVTTLADSISHATQDEVALPAAMNTPDIPLPESECLYATGCEAATAQHTGFALLSRRATFVLLLSAVYGGIIGTAALLGSAQVSVLLWCIWALSYGGLFFIILQFLRLRDCTEKPAFRISSRFLYCDAQKPRDISTCFITRKTIHPNGLTELTFLHARKNEQKGQPIALSPDSRQTEIEHLLDTLALHQLRTKEDE